MQIIHINKGNETFHQLVAVTVIVWVLIGVLVAETDHVYSFPV